MTLGIVMAHTSYRSVPGTVLYIDVFFTASAYYITSLLLRDIGLHGRIDYGGFYRRRFAKILPPLLVMLAVYLLFSWLFQPVFSSALARAAIVLSYISNYWYIFDPKSIQDLGHTWTLSTEEQFYVLWPVVFTFLVRRLGVTWRLVLAIGAIGAAVWAWRSPAHRPRCGVAAIIHRFRHPCGFVDGRMCDGGDPEAGPAWKISDLGLPLAQACVAIVAVLGRGHLFFWPYTGPSYNYYYFGSILCGVVPGILALTMLIRSSGTICHRIFERPEAVFLGRIFYGVYLWHLPILNAMDGYEIGWRYRLLIGLPLSIIVATLSYAYLERYFLRRRPAALKPQPTQAPLADDAPALAPLLVRPKGASSRA